MLLHVQIESKRRNVQMYKSIIFLFITPKSSWYLLKYVIYERNSMYVVTIFRYYNNRHVGVCLKIPE